MTVNEFGTLLKGAYREWSDDNASRLGAALAYYTVFSLAPLLLIVIAVAGLVWPESGAAHQEIVGQMRQLLGPEGADLVSSMLDSASRPGSGSVVATVVGVVTLIFGATTVFTQLQGALNAVWNVEPEPGRGLKNVASARLLSFGLILAVGFLLLVSLVISAGVSAMEGLLPDAVPGTQALVQTLNLIVSLGIVTLLFAMIYRYLPDVSIAWRDVWVGAFVTAALFTLGKWALGAYIANSSVGSAYGAAGSLVVLLFWVYYSAQIFFFGAELTQVYARMHGSRIRPSRRAVWSDPERAEAFGPKVAARPRTEKASRVAPAATVPAPLPARRRPLWKRALPLAVAFLVGRAMGGD